MVRYFVEHLPAHTDPHHSSQRSVAHVHCREYHWLRVDENTIVGIGNFRSKTGIPPGLTVLPHLHDSTPVKVLLPADKHGMLKAKLHLDDSDSTSDFIGKLLAAGHSQFEPPI